MMRIVGKIGMDLSGTIVSLDGVYDCRANRKAIFNRSMIPNINPNPRGSKQPKRGRKPIFDQAIFKERFRTIERVFAWEDKFRRLQLRFERISGLALRVQDARLYDDQSPALLPDLIFEPLSSHWSISFRRLAPRSRLPASCPETARHGINHCMVQRICSPLPYHFCTIIAVPALPSKTRNQSLTQAAGACAARSHGDGGSLSGRHRGLRARP